jgi:hypothetical protein
MEGEHVRTRGAPNGRPKAGTRLRDVLIRAAAVSGCVDRAQGCMLWTSLERRLGSSRRLRHSDGLRQNPTLIDRRSAFAASCEFAAGLAGRG